MGYDYPSGMPSDALLTELDLEYVKEALQGLSAGG
jgi:hypothetical protein